MLVGSQPSARRPVIRSIRGPCAATQTCGGTPWYGSRPSTASSRSKNLPWKSTGLVVLHSSRMTLIASSSTPTGLSKLSPYGVMFMRSPEPRPRIARPDERWSAVRAARASIAGWRRILSVTQTPTLIVDVAAPAAPIIISGSKWTCGLSWYLASSVISSVQTESGIQPIRWHGHQIASKPSASARWANSIAFAAGGMIRPGAPSVTRMRKRLPPNRLFGYAASTMEPRRVSVITGGAGGIALACARELADRGPVLLADVDAGRLEAVAEGLRGETAAGARSFFTAVCDVADPDSVLALARRAAE